MAHGESLITSPAQFARLLAQLQWHQRARELPGPVSACFAEQEAVAECAMQLRRIGDKWNLRQKILNLLAKLFCPET
ncbi:phorbol-12-myristate-13-acetate-induced protein 1 [Apteryx rowi]|uniref:phorbol-12-myristate-13-acetate-induced protein 1 n=1 Tax=Apteryx rowi TaxID=308060 RepID=UPI000E1C47BC|nr:phorbol-12-myristate-13-acetate-induced protein 1 [Apteryx rowi]